MISKGSKYQNIAKIKEVTLSKIKMDQNSSQKLKAVKCCPNCYLKPIIKFLLKSKNGTVLSKS